MKTLTLKEAYDLINLGGVFTCRPPFDHQICSKRLYGNAVANRLSDEEACTESIVYEGARPEIAATFTHAFNVLPEVEEVLVKASQDLLARHIVDSILYEERHPNLPALAEPELLALIRDILTKINTVEIPG